MLELITFANVKDDRYLNYSPFCSKVEIFLKLNKIEFNHTEHNGPLKKFPKQKLPVLVDNKSIIHDSSFIIEYLIEKYNLEIDGHLTDLDHANGQAYTSLIEEHLYWAIVSERWLIDSNWLKLRASITKGIPKPIAVLVGKIIRNMTIKNTMGQGFGRFNEEERFRIAQKLIKSASVFLADKPYILGDKISSYDATFYATASNLIYCDLAPKLQSEAIKFKNLVDYCQRMKSLLQ